MFLFSDWLGGDTGWGERGVFVSPLTALGAPWSQRWPPWSQAGPSVPRVGRLTFKKARKERWCNYVFSVCLLPSARPLAHCLAQSRYLTFCSVNEAICSMGGQSVSG